MIRGFQLADFLTLANAACGVLAIFAVLAYVESLDLRRLLAAAALIPLALVFDILDGRVARSRRRHSAMGRELDSLADVISFGVAPAAIAYAAGMKGLWDVVILVYFVACGVSRSRSSRRPASGNGSASWRPWSLATSPRASSWSLSWPSRPGSIASATCSRSAPSASVRDSFIR